MAEATHGIAVVKPYLELDLSLKRGDRLWAFSLKTSARFIAIEGPSGVGKTSLLRTLAGIEKQARGTLGIGGQLWQSPRSFVAPWNRRVGWVPQDALLFPHLDVLENLAYSGASTLDETRAIADELQISQLLKRRVRDLSGGERQRVSLGRALLSRPALLLLDEPFSALEAELRLRLMSWLRARCEDHAIGLILASHHADECSALCDERYRMASRGALLNGS